jgi:hypothetical protein
MRRETTWQTVFKSYSKGAESHRRSVKANNSVILLPQKPAEEFLIDQKEARFLALMSARVLFAIYPKNILVSFMEGD